jgi:O-acetylhomoserine (thiol)-lyase
MNPTTDVFEERVASLEGGIGALATSSGQARSFCHQLAVPDGRRLRQLVDAVRRHVHAVRHHLPALGFNAIFVDPDDPENFRKAITPKTKCIYIETISNPRINITDIEAVAKIAHDAGIPLMVDNTFASPYLCRPIEHGADIVVHSTTKFIGGHGTAIGGMIVDSGKFDWTNGKFPQLTEPSPGYHGLKFVRGARPDGLSSSRRAWKACATLGPCQTPFNSFLFLQGLETLPMRMERHCANALAVAKHLEGAPAGDVGQPCRPDLEPVQRDRPEVPAQGLRRGLHVRHQGRRRAGAKFIDSLKLFSIWPTWATPRAWSSIPASTTHQQLSEADQKAAGVTPDMVRLSIGLEDLDDIIWDLDQALAKSQA